MAQLQFWILGPLQVWRGDARLDLSLPGQRARSLLALFLTERGRFVPSERAIDCIWPHLDPGSALNNLQVAVRQLRRWLEPAVPRGRHSSYLLTELGGYRFAVGDGYVDVDEFTRTAAQGQAALRSNDLPSARTAFERGRRLYRGEYLSDYPYADWVLPERERLREAHLQMLEALVATYLRLGLYEEAATACQHALRMDAFREVFYRHLMYGCAAQGRRAEALAAFAQHEALLRQELDIPPSPELLALRDSILTGALPRAELPSRRASGPSVELPLVGRAGVSQQLRAAWEERRGAVLVTGESGVGKTRLLTEFAATVPSAVFWSRGRENDIPFGAALNFLDDYLQTDPPLSALAPLRPLGAPLAQYLPKLCQRWPDCSPHTPLAVDAERERLHHAALAALRLIAEPPAVFVLDDLQWAGEDSLAVFSDLLREPPRGLFIFACRSEDLSTDGPLAAWVAAERKGQRLLEIELPPLAAADVLEAVRAVTALPDPVRLSQRLYDITDGHPLFLAETLRELIDSGRLADGPQSAALIDLAELPLSHSLRETILARVRGLDPFERETLTAASIFRGGPTSPALASVLRAEPAQVESALQRLSTRKLLAPARSPGGWEFTHRLIREAIYDDLADSHRRLLNRLAAEALIAQHPRASSAIAGDIVEHLRNGEGASRALAEWAVAAGQWAYSHFAHVQARQYFELAERVVNQLSDAERDPNLELEAVEGLALAQLQTGQVQEAKAGLERGLRLAGQPGDRARLLLARARIGEHVTGEYDHALALLTEAEEWLRRAGIEDRAALSCIHATRARVHYWRGEYEKGEHFARCAMDEARQTPEAVDALRALGINLHKLGRVEEAADIFRQVLRMAEAAGDLRNIAAVYSNLGMSLQASGQLAEAVKAEERSLAIRQQLGDVRGESIVETNIGIHLGALGDLAASASELRRAIQLAEAVGAPYTAAVARHHLGKALTLRGYWDEAQSEFEAALALARSIDAAVIEAQAHFHYALGCWYWGDDQAAAAHARAALEIGGALGDNLCRREPPWLLGLLRLKEGNLDAAEALAREAGEIARQASQKLAVGRAERLLGQIAAARERRAEAGKHFAESERLFRESGARVELGETLLARAQCEPSPGSHSREEWLLEARRLFRRAKAAPLLRQVEGMLPGDLRRLPAAAGRPN